MARLVTKFKYLKPDARSGVGGYAKYIATREGVDRINDTQRLESATGKQKELIEKIIKDFPESRELLEYEDYLSAPNMGNASEFLFHAMEENTSAMLDVKTYVDYIAMRPRAERIGAHGLFTSEGVSVKLNQVSRELNAYTGNVYTAIISLRREDAERLGFNTGERWRSMLRTQTQDLAEQLHIPQANLKWYAAFHNEGHHPHVHLIAYSDDPKEGYLSEQGIRALRSSMARAIFAQELQSVYQKQTEYRNTLRARSRALVRDIVTQMNYGFYVNHSLEQKLQLLAERLSSTSGKKVYGYLKPELKDLVDSIVWELARDPRIAQLYDLWYEQKEETIRTYTNAIPKRVPLEENQEFKPIKNAVIQEALRLVPEVQEEVVTEEEEIPEPEFQPSRYYTPTNAPTQQEDTPSAASGILRLLYQLSHALQQDIHDEGERADRGIDRKQWQTINEKKHAHGQKQG